MGAPDCSVGGVEGGIILDSSKPDGQMKKILDVSRMKRVSGWELPPDLRPGFERTIGWYIESKEAAHAQF